MLEQKKASLSLYSIINVQNYNTNNNNNNTTNESIKIYFSFRNNVIFFLYI